MIANGYIKYDLTVAFWHVDGFVVRNCLFTEGGCEDNRNNFMVDDTLSFVNEEQYAGVSVYNGKYEFAILKNGKGPETGHCPDAT